MACCSHKEGQGKTQVYVKARLLPVKGKGVCCCYSANLMHMYRLEWRCGIAAQMDGVERGVADVWTGL